MVLEPFAPGRLSVYGSPVSVIWTTNGNLHGWIYSEYWQNPQNNLSTAECIRLANDYYRFFGGRYELVKCNLDESTEAYRPQYVLLDFDKIVPGTKIKISGGFTAAIDVTYGIPFQLSGLYEPPLPAPVPTLARAQLESRIFMATDRDFGWWQTDAAVAQDPVYVQSGDTYRLVHDCTAYDPNSWDQEKGRYTTFIVYRLDAVTGQTVYLVPSWASGSPATPPTTRFSWAASTWGFAKSAAKSTVAAAKAGPDPKGKPVRLTNGKSWCKALWSGAENLLYTKQGTTWIAGRPDKMLRDLLEQLP